MLRDTQEQLHAAIYVAARRFISRPLQARTISAGIIGISFLYCILYIEPAGVLWTMRGCAMNFR